MASEQAEGKLRIAVGLVVLATLSLQLFPAFIGLLLAQLYEQENRAQFKAADLSDRDAGGWKRMAVVPAVVGIVLGCIAGAILAAGDTSTGFLLLPIALRDLRSRYRANAQVQVPAA